MGRLFHKANTRRIDEWRLFVGAGHVQPDFIWLSANLPSIVVLLHRVFGRAPYVRVHSGIISKGQNLEGALLCLRQQVNQARTTEFKLK